MIKRFLAILILAFFLAWPLACGNDKSNPSGPVTVFQPVTVIGTPTPTGVAGQDWFFTTLNAAFSARQNHTSVVYNDKMWVIGGFDGSTYKADVYYSTDGITWIQATGAAAFGSRGNHTTLVYNPLTGSGLDGKMWVIGGFGAGYLHDVYSSVDGATWIQVTAAAAFSGRTDHTSLVYNNKMWVIGGNGPSGYLNDVYYSSDGVTWTLATAAAAFNGRMGLSSLVYNNLMWVIGGYDGSNKHDVYYSSDGVTWTLATAAAAFSVRSYFTALVYNNQMWVIGGNGSDAWYSTDGVAWTRATATAPFGVRNSHTSVVYDNKMWVIGGASGSAYKNDVWQSPGS